MSEQLKSLLAALQSEFPGLEVSMSGPFVDLRYAGRCFALEESPEGIGISELRGEAEDWLGGHQRCFWSIGGAQRYLFKLLPDLESRLPYED